MNIRVRFETYQRTWHKDAINVEAARSLASGLVQRWTYPITATVLNGSTEVCEYNKGVSCRYA